MADETKAGILITLRDKFSQGIKGAAAATKNFSSGAIGALDGVDKALSGTAAKLGALGVSFSLGAASKEIIDIDARLTRMGMTADASAEQVNQLKQKIFEAAQDPNIKIDPSQIIDALDVVMTKTGDLKYVEDNIKNIGIAIQASGESGESMGDVFSEFQKFGYDAASISQLMDDLVKQGDTGEYTFGKFAKTAKAVLSAYAPIGTSVEDTKKLGAVMQILIAGTKNEEAAVTALDSVMSELSDPSKQEKLKQIGVAVRDNEGKFRDLADVMQDVLKVVELEGNSDFLGEVFGMTSMKAIRAFQQYGKNYKGLTEGLGDTTGALADKSARMAGTMQANLKNLQTSFLRFADANLAKPLEKLNDFLGYMGENPERFKRVFNTIRDGLITIVAIKGIAKTASFVSSIADGFKNLKSGKTEIGLGAGAANGMPVYVTNWGGQAGASPLPTDGTGAGGAPGASPKKGVRLSGKQAAGYGAAAAVLTAVTAIPTMMGELSDVDNSDLKGKEKSKAKGGAIGEAVGKIGGAAGGAIAGAAIGSVVPVIGTAVGALVGGAVGWLGGWLGRKAGEAIGSAVGKDDVVPQSESIKKELAQVKPVPRGELKAELEGNAVMDVNVHLTDNKTQVSAQVTKNSTPFRYNTGRVQEARSVY